MAMQNQTSSIQQIARAANLDIYKTDTAIDLLVAHGKIYKIEGGQYTKYAKRAPEKEGSDVIEKLTNQKRKKSSQKPAQRR
jgi:predicted transcriptional regulator